MIKKVPINMYVLKQLVNDEYIHINIKCYIMFFHLNFPVIFFYFCLKSIARNRKGDRKPKRLNSVS